MAFELPKDFPYDPPKGYSYEVTSFNRNLLAIWICNHGKFSYTDKTPKSIWGFYDRKKECYYAPINATKSGDKVEIKNTTAYSAMQIAEPPLTILSFMV